MHDMTAIREGAAEQALPLPLVAAGRRVVGWLLGVGWGSSWGWGGVGLPIDCMKSKTSPLILP